MAKLAGRSRSGDQANEDLPRRFEEDTSVLCLYDGKWVPATVKEQDYEKKGEEFAYLCVLTEGRKKVPIKNDSDEEIRCYDAIGAVACGLAGELLEAVLTSELINRFGAPLFVLAVKHGHIHIMDLLCDQYKISPVAQNDACQTGVHCIAQSPQKFLTIRKLIEWFSRRLETEQISDEQKMRWNDNVGRNPFHFAAEANNLEFMKAVRSNCPLNGWLPWSLLVSRDLNEKLPVDYATTAPMKRFIKEWVDEYQETLVETTAVVLKRLDAWKIDSATLNVRELIGQGTYGRVCRADWRGTPVAVKLLFSNALAENAAKFEQELDIMRQLHHPNVTQFLGFSLTPDMELLIVMELAKHRSIENYISAHRSIPLKLKMRWADEMAQSLAYLHGRKPNFLIHRDIKPSNFMVTEALNVKLGDFGVSRMFDGAVPYQPPTHDDMDRSTSSWADQEDTIVNEMDQTANCGTYRYMAPEVQTDTMGQAKYSRQADIFSLGLVFYYVLEGIAPSFKGATTPAKHFDALKRGLRPKFTSKTNSHMRMIIEACWDLSPSARPTAQELVYLTRAKKSRGLKKDANQDDVFFHAENAWARIMRQRSKENLDKSASVDEASLPTTVDSAHSSGDGSRRSGSPSRSRFGFRLRSLSNSRARLGKRASKSSSSSDTMATFQEELHEASLAS